MKKSSWIAGAAALALASGLTFAAVSQHKKRPGYDDTPALPGQPCKVHDSKRPHPAVVTPGAEPGKPPSDAIVLFDGTDQSKWKNDKGEAAAWKVENGYFEAVPKGGD